MPIDAIFCGDLHLRETTPRARKDDFLATQFRKLQWLDDLATEHGCAIICAGDVLHNWRISPGFISELMLRLPAMYTVLGNHDLPLHNLSRCYESGVSPLVLAKILGCGSFGSNSASLPTGDCAPCMCDYGVTPPEFPPTPYSLLVTHTFVYKGRSPWPGCTAPNDKEMMEKYKNWRTILTGDNHKTFVTRKDDGSQLLVNCGSFLRMNIDQKDHKPCVFLWNSEENTATPVYVPIEEDVFVDAPIEISSEEVSTQLKEFVNQLSAQNVGVSFSDNIQRGLDASILSQEAKECVVQWMSNAQTL